MSPELGRCIHSAVTHNTSSVRDLLHEHVARTAGVGQFLQLLADKQLSDPADNSRHTFSESTRYANIQKLGRSMITMGTGFPRRDQGTITASMEVPRSSGCATDLGSTQLIIDQFLIV